LQLGDLLIQAKLVSVDQVSNALEVQAVSGGRLGDHLVTAGAIERKVLDAFLHRMPTEPDNIPATKIDETELLTLLMKLIYTGRLESVRQFAEAIKLPYHIVLDLVRMAVDRQLLRTLGAREADSLIEMSYAFTEEGRRWALDALQQSRYAGPAPVTLEDFNERVNLQKITNELITFENIRESLRGLTFPDSFIEQSGPALNSGRAILFYGPPGNGKTSVALRFASVFDDVIYVPYAIMVEGQIVRMYDPSIHLPLNAVDVGEDNDFSLARREELDARWVPCRRPFVVTGGELTLEMLDLRFNTTARFYEAPLHMKALGGCFIIDDFGRQLVSPTHLLNRWIVPLESRVDYLKLHTGKTFSIPFEELVIFSTNLDPEDLMDPAFLRRLPYKIEIGSPSREAYDEIFMNECRQLALEISQESLDLIAYKVTQEKRLDLAAFQPKFIIDQVVATCRFMGEPAHFEPRFIDYAMDNLRVRREGDTKSPQASPPPMMSSPATADAFAFA
jgi:hypothetical protein